MTEEQSLVGSVCSSDRQVACVSHFLEASFGEGHVPCDPLSIIFLSLMRFPKYNRCSLSFHMNTVEVHGASVCVHTNICVDIGYVDSYALCCSL